MNLTITHATCNNSKQHSNNGGYNKIPLLFECQFWRILPIITFCVDRKLAFESLKLNSKGPPDKYT